MSGLRILSAGPGLTVQDLGRTGTMGFGLSPGGAADRIAFIEGCALLGQDLDAAALEMAGYGGSFQAESPLRFALTGAPMAATIDGQPIPWNASHTLEAGQILSIGGATAGIYGYLHLGGGIDAPSFLGSRATHLAAGIGQPLRQGAQIATGPDLDPDNTGQKLPVSPRWTGGTVRVLPSVQTHLFDPDTIARFGATPFTRTPRGNRQGAELTGQDAPFASGGQLTILSESMVSGDIQMTGEGVPFVLLPECQTTGGYPRIGTILPDDLPLVAQAGRGATLRFKFISHAEGLKAHMTPAQRLKATQKQLEPLLRDPADIRDLLRYQLISGAITGNETQ